jgi:hypothetical protein
VTQHNIGRDNNILTETAAFPDHATFHDMGKVPYFCSAPDPAPFVDHSGFMRKISGIHI